jgi:hypothetical protein
MNNKNSTRSRSLPRWIRQIFFLSRKKLVNLKKYIAHRKGNQKLLFLSIVATTIATIVLITYGIANWQNSQKIPLISSGNTPTKSTSQPIQPPSIVSSSSIPNSIPQIPPKVPLWAKNSKDFQLPAHRSIWDNNRGISYVPDNKPLFKPSKKLTAVVGKIINLIKKRKLSTNSVSITLIDANTGEIAEYQQDKLRFPASIAKLFWLVTLEGQIEAKMWNNSVGFDPFVKKMMTESDNDSSSFIIDNITGSYSSKEQVPNNILNPWLKQRQFRINEYFKAAEYNPNINLTQKTYPIPYLELSKPTGNELQIRANPTNLNQPIRNSLTTFDAARLMYEACYKKQAVSGAISTKICSLLERNVDKKEWSKIKADDFNPIQSFFGEYLPSKNVKFYSKAGWVPTLTRAEVCLVKILDRNKSYILAVFAEDPAFDKDKIIFPEMSKLVYDEMKYTTVK